MNQYQTYKPTRFMGVYHNGDGRFIAFFGKPGRRRLVGFFGDALSAALHYDAAITVRYRIDAKTNRIRGLFTEADRFDMQARQLTEGTAP